jgi:hypothetical protein
MTANVILARCTAHKKLFGIRIEERDSDWVRTWAFPIDETRAVHEGFDKTEISGSLEITPEYPGCPYCSNSFLLVCTCGKLLCCERDSGSEGYEVCCDWCGAVTKEVEYSDRVSVDSGDY